MDLVHVLWQPRDDSIQREGTAFDDLQVETASPQIDWITSLRNFLPYGCIWNDECGSGQRSSNRPAT